MSSMIYYNIMDKDQTLEQRLTTVKTDSNYAPENFERVGNLVDYINANPEKPKQYGRFLETREDYQLCYDIHTEWHNKGIKELLHKKEYKANGFIARFTREKGKHGWDPLELHYNTLPLEERLEQFKTRIQENNGMLDLDKKEYSTENFERVGRFMNYIASHPEKKLKPHGMLETQEDFQLCYDIHPEWHNNIKEELYRNKELGAGGFMAAYQEKVKKLGWKPLELHFDQKSLEERLVQLKDRIQENGGNPDLIDFEEYKEENINRVGEVLDSISTGISYNSLETQEDFQLYYDIHPEWFNHAISELFKDKTLDASGFVATFWKRRKENDWGNLELHNNIPYEKRLEQFKTRINEENGDTTLLDAKEYSEESVQRVGRFLDYATKYPTKPRPQRYLETIEDLKLCLAIHPEWHGKGRREMQQDRETHGNGFYQKVDREGFVEEIFPESKHANWDGMSIGKLIQYRIDNFKGMGKKDIAFDKENKGQSFYAALGRRGVRDIVLTKYTGKAEPEDKTRTFLIDTFGSEINVDSYKEYFAKKGGITNLRKLPGGFCAQAVVSIGNIVVKLDDHISNAIRQREFNARELGEINGFIPKPISEVAVIDDVALWDMENVSNRYKQENLFDRSRKKRAAMDMDAVKVLEKLNDKQYMIQTYNAVKQGAHCLYDKIDHCLYVLGLFHTEATMEKVGDLGIPLLEVTSDKYKNRIMAVRKKNEIVLPNIKNMITPDHVSELLSPLDYAVGLLKEGNVVLHGDAKAENWVNGALIDPRLRIGKEVEDIAMLLEDPEFNLSPEMINHFINRYIQHRGMQDNNFRDNMGKHKGIHEEYNVAAYKENVRRFGAMQKRDLIVPKYMNMMQIFHDKAMEAQIN